LVRTFGLLSALLLPFEASAANEQGLKAFEHGDYATAASEFSEAASAGDSNAMVNLSLIYDSHCGVEPSGWEGQDFFDRAIKAGNPIAKFLSMENGLWGNGPAPTIEEARTLTKAAAYEGYPLAMLQIGFSRLFSPNDAAQSYAWFGMFLRRALPSPARDEGQQRFTQLARKLSPDQIARGKELLDQLDQQVPQSKIIAAETCPGKDATSYVPVVRLPESSAPTSYSIAEIATVGTRPANRTSEIGATAALRISEEGQVTRGEIPLPDPLRGRGFVGYGTNNQGKIVGSYPMASSARGRRAFVYTPREGTADIDAPGWHGAEAWAINDMGQVTGSAGCGGFIYTPGQEVKRISPVCATGRAINEHGDVAGEFMAFRQGATSFHAFIYSSERGMQDLGTLGGCCSFGYGINAHGTVVGSAATESNGKVFHAFVYFPDAGIYDLNTLIPAGSGWELIEARGINARGQIVGWGISSEVKQVFVLTPVSK
jgi:probable HAF family extracellular repeat protein